MGSMGTEVPGPLACLGRWLLPPDPESLPSRASSPTGPPGLPGTPTGPCHATPQAAGGVHQPSQDNGSTRSVGALIGADSWRLIISPDSQKIQRLPALGGRDGKGSWRGAPGAGQTPEAAAPRGGLGSGRDRAEAQRRWADTALPAPQAEGRAGGALPASPRTQGRGRVAEHLLAHHMPRTQCR